MKGHVQKCFVWAKCRLMNTRVYLTHECINVNFFSHEILMTFFEQSWIFFFFETNTQECVKPFIWRMCERSYKFFFNEKNCKKTKLCRVNLSRRTQPSVKILVLYKFNLLSTWILQNAIFLLAHSKSFHLAVLGQGIRNCEILCYRHQSNLQLVDPTHVLVSKECSR